MNIEKISLFVNEVLGQANIPYREHIDKFVHQSLEAKKRFLPIGFDEMGRKEVQFDQTMSVICDDNSWLGALLNELEISTEHIATINNIVYVIDGTKGMSLTKALKKREARLFCKGRKWHKTHPDQYYKDWRPNHGRNILVPDLDETGSCRLDYNGARMMVHQYTYDPPSINKFLAELGDIVNLKRKAYLTINPGDILRQALKGPMCSFSTCHDLARGSYKVGPINYAIDSAHLMSYLIQESNPDQIIGRSMVFISEDKSTVGQRRFYPTTQIFGMTRARHIREDIHSILNPNITKFYSTKTKLDNLKFQGYLDPVEIWTSIHDKEEDINNSIDLSSDVFCFKCGSLHQSKTNLYCCEDSK